MANSEFTTQAETREFSRMFVDAVSDPSTEKQAAELGERFIRWRQREQGFMRKFLPTRDVVDSELQMNEWSPNPRVIGEMEPDCPGAVSVGYADTPTDFYITPKRYATTETMILSPRVNCFEQQMRTYGYDVRQVFADNIVKDTLAEEDVSGISAVNAILLGADTNMYGSGVAQWRTLSGGISRTNIVEGNKTLLRTPNMIAPESALATVNTLMDFMKWDRNEAGGDIAEQQLRNGWVEMKMFGLNWFGTIKRYLVPDATVYYFGAPKYLGVNLLFTPMRMFVEKKIFRYNFFTAHGIGTNFVNVAALGRVDYPSS